ncbi:MAG: cytochrome c [Fulvimarina manganoxydans]|uniref:c-type cytochrome n=1 Tax=Fulvimarina manganoxydans TaxID=937218 RepID=UPI00235563F6|nr:cytochrome c [Fulvimarina manganoxydans]MCK5931033.1 cytochrome c [Fulvimarina manganoxydans]
MKTSRTTLAVTIGIVAIGAFLIWRAITPQTGAADHIVDVTVPKLSAQASYGQKLFADDCAACHGENAGGTEQGPPLIHRIYEPSHHGDRAFLIAAMQGTRAHHWQFGNMPPVEGITERQVQDIVAYVREVQKANDVF